MMKLTSKMLQTMNAVACHYDQKVWRQARKTVYLRDCCLAEDSHLQFAIPAMIERAR